MFQVHVLHSLDLFSTVIFAASGTLLARDQQRNLAMAMLFAVLTAVGGGTLRDIFLYRPIFWTGEPAYLLIALTVGLLMFALSTCIHIHREHLWLADAIGLAIFTVVGTQVAMQHPALARHIPAYWLLPPAMGLLTGVGGGLVRDMLSVQAPYIIQNPYYALASFVGGGVYSLLAGIPPVPAVLALGMSHWLPSAGAMATVILMLPAPAQVILNLLPVELPSVAS